MASFVVTGGSQLSRGPAATTPWGGDRQGPNCSQSSHHASSQLRPTTSRWGIAPPPTSRRECGARSTAWWPSVAFALDRSPSGFRRPESWGVPFVRKPLTDANFSRDRDRGARCRPVATASTTALTRPPTRLFVVVPSARLRGTLGLLWQRLERQYQRGGREHTSRVLSPVLQSR